MKSIYNCYIEVVKKTMNIDYIVTGEIKLIFFSFSLNKGHNWDLDLELLTAHPQKLYYLRWTSGAN